jgi:hypothetical protein
VRDDQAAAERVGAVTGSVVETEAQWALHGRNADSEGHDVLACSTGPLSRENFADAISRFQLGELSSLPQVSVSYARLAGQPGVGYLALAIDDFASRGQRTAHDRYSRPITYTSYFCLPYLPLAEQAIGYLSIYEAVRRVTLPGASGPPLRVTLAPPDARILAADPLAMRVAALLLTGRPVCVLGADETTTDERLRFIDSVMTLVPYGLRARMAAATWTRATHGGHRFRLFFSSAPRTGTQPDHVVTWGEPDQVSIPGGPPAEYLGWLEDCSRPLARLAEVTTEMGFDRKGRLQVLELALSSRAGPLQTPTGPTAPTEPATTRDAWTGPLPLPPAEHDPVETALLGFAEDARLANPIRLRSDIALLKKLAENEIGEDRRERYRELISRLGLLRHNSVVESLVEGKHEERLYEALLRMAFGIPLGYRAYCEVEKCAGIAHGDAPRQGLLTAIVKAGMADLVVGAIVCWHLRETDDKELNKFLTGQPDPARMIRQLAVHWSYPQHARIFCDVTLELLDKARGRYEPQRLLPVLRQHGFLARALQMRHPKEEQYQVDTLRQFLEAAYPAGLGRSAIVQVLAGCALPPTPALLAAVLVLDSWPEHVKLAHEAYIQGSLTCMNVGSATATRLRELLPESTQVNSASPGEQE